VLQRDSGGVTRGRIRSGSPRKTHRSRDNDEERTRKDRW
jgi:hypothetical protein